MTFVILANSGISSFLSQSGLSSSPWAVIVIGILLLMFGGNIVKGLVQILGMVLVLVEVAIIFGFI